MDLSSSAWDNRYLNNDIGWDLGEVSPPLKAYFDQLTNKQLKILIPGGGNSYEAEYLFKNGFKNVFVIDLSKTALDNIKTRVPSFPLNQLIEGDFFNLDDVFDLVIEQTFFCAISPSLRLEYAEKVAGLLKPSGKLVGLMFDAPLNTNNPPYGGNRKEYRSYFKPFFDIQIMETSYNSISTRIGKEVFVKIIKR